MVMAECLRCEAAQGKHGPCVHTEDSLSARHGLDSINGFCIITAVVSPIHLYPLDVGQTQ